MISRTVSLGILVCLLATRWAVAADPANALPVRVRFDQHVRPILVRHCIACHGGVKQVADLSFVDAAGMRPPGGWVIEPGDPEASLVIQRVTAEDSQERMPPADHGPALSSSEVELLRRWIRQGAQPERHWAFDPPQRQPLPPVTDAQWCRTPLDRFVLARLEQEGLSPSPEASPVQWLRRVTFDLTGLPPSLAEIDAFLADRADGAHVRVVDRLLDSPRFGERWAALWMDLARYADSQGYEKDSLRTMWPYRDWLLRALNEDMPYDQFTIRQLAGDLLPGATLHDIAATAFHRNTPTNAEGGTDDEEFRVAAVVDRVATTWEVWQGLTFRCIQCHAHPYEPIGHDEYYRFFALWNTSKDWDLREDLPKLVVPFDEKEFARARTLDARLTALRTHLVLRTAQLAEKSRWEYLEAVHAESSGKTELVVEQSEDGVPEVLARGTVSHDSRFTLEFVLPGSVLRLTALRMDALPLDPARALHTPEPGFVISQLQAELLPAAGAAEESVPVSLTWALGDEVQGFDEAQATLDPDDSGWGAEPRITHPRRLVLVLGQPVDVPYGARLRLILRQEDAPNDLAQLVVRRSRYAASGDDVWSDGVLIDELRSVTAEISEVMISRGAISGAALPVMAEQDLDLRRATAVFERGDWQRKSRVVQPGIPRLFRGGGQPDVTNRLDFARWLVSDDNPLTARVAVNRFWHELLGAGLVETVSDFGTSGQRPSHPALLDHLALRFQREHGWSIKRLLREIVLSATYRQDATTAAGLGSRDPANRLLARGPRNRLTAEMVRDNALAVSGLLIDKLGGPSVMPPQPDGVWRAARSNLKWETESGEDRYRRAVYTYWRRSSPYPSMLTFDAPIRLVCSGRRVTTNTPLQALVTLNDPAFVECAVALAGRMTAATEARPHESQLEARLALGYRLATGTLPARADLQDLTGLYDASLRAYLQDPQAARKLAGTPHEAALALVANAILNLDQVLTK